MSDDTDDDDILCHGTPRSVWQDVELTDADVAMLCRILDDHDPDAPGKCGPKMRARLEGKRVSVRVVGDPEVKEASDE